MSSHPIDWEKFMKSFKMKALAVAVLGLAGMGSVMAACPTVAAGNVTGGGAGGGAWFGQSQGGGATLSIVTPGLDSTNCALNIAVSATPAPNMKGLVIDNSPQNEARYRARFYFNASSLSLTAPNVQTEVFDAFATTAPGTFGTDEVQIFLIGGATPAVRFVVADSGKSNGVATISSTLPSATGSYYVEFDLTKGAGSSSTVACNGGDAGCFRYWIVAQGGTTPADATPTGTYSASNAGWSGIIQAQLGLYSATAKFRQNNVSTNSLTVDEFDSRRQTFIGF
jgi:hypothetical protein